MVTVLNTSETLDHSERPGGLRGRGSVVAAAGAVIVLLALLGLNYVLTISETNQVTSLLLLASLAVAWNLMAGFGGQFSLGHSIFIGLGGYLTAILLTKTELPLTAAVVLAALAAAVLGVVLAYPMIRLRGPYFSIGTLGLTLAVTGWMLNWDFTNRSQAYPLPFADLLRVRSVYVLAVVVAVVTFGSVFAVMRTGLGLRVLALRDDEVGAASLGVPRTSTLLPVWAVSAFLTGLIGATYAVQKGTLDPQSAFSLQFTLDAIVICVIGGLGTLTGPLVGAVLVYLMRQIFADYASVATLLEALLVVLVVRFVPGGIVPAVGRLARGRAFRRTSSRGSRGGIRP